eukprot:95741-Pleurochrysis_carterae.AAC.5
MLRWLLCSLLCAPSCVQLSTHLRDPVEVVDLVDTGSGHVGEHVAAVHVERHQGAERHPLQFCQLRTHQGDHLAQLLRARGFVRTNAVAPVGDERGLCFARPVDLVDGEHDHPRPAERPVEPRPLLVRRVRLLHHVGHRLLHRLLHLHQPLLDHAVCGRGVDHGRELHALALDRAHRVDEHRVVELERLYPLKALAQMRLHAQRVLGLRQDLQQLVVGEEEEAREGETLRLEVVVEPLLDQFEQPVGLLPRAEQPLLRSGDEHARFGGGVGHGLAPDPVDVREAFRLLRHLAHDVLGRKDWLEIEPDRLTFDPLVEDLLHRDEPRLPLAHAPLDRLDVRRAAHRLRRPKRTRRRVKCVKQSMNRSDSEAVGRARMTRYDR